MNVSKEVLPVLIVALVTWGGVWGYLFRLDLLTRSLESKLVDLELRRAPAPGDDQQ